MANGGWIIVLVIIVLAIIAGFMVSNNMHLNENAKIGQAALEISAEQYATANAQVTLSAGEIEKNKTEIANGQAQMETATADKNACNAENGKISKERDNAQEAVRIQQTTISAMSNHAPVAGGSAPQAPVVDSNRTTAVPTSIPVTGDWGSPTITWLPVLVLGFFTIVVVGAYRMLKIEDRAQAQAR